jgi:hypothetical protein
VDEIWSSQAAKRPCRNFLFVGCIFVFSIAETDDFVHEPGALPHGLKRKIDKLSKWESQSPAADRGLSDHAQRLESRAGSLGKQSYMKERWIIMAPQLDWIPAYLRLGAYSPQL